ncbi:MAG: replication initiator protein A [Pirellulaceae bacterium]
MEQSDNEGRDDIQMWEGRDEMNLAEFPIACLASRPDKGVKTLQFEDRIWDRGQRARIVRRLTISASDQYGLPTALDDEVILGLIQLTRETDFASRHVFFSRYQLIRILGWRNEGKSYSRLETSLKRWIGVTFYYENAWWDHAKQSWVDENFHVLERVSLLGRGGQKARAHDKEPALSMFCWNEVVFRSFQAGYLKSIDMELFRCLESPIAKRLYRLLDKRFYHKNQWEFDLRELACEHVGLSRSYDTAGLKRKLRPAIAELESIGYLKTVNPEQRFIRLARGRWQIHFQRNVVPRGGSKKNQPSAEHKGDMRSTLIARGVNPVTAGRLVADHPADVIRKHVDAVDWLLANDRRHAPRNPAGFLVQSIRDGYALGELVRERTGIKPARDGSRRDDSMRRSQARRADASSASKRNGIDDYLRKLAPEQLQQIEQKALLAANPFLVSAYQRVVSEGSPLLIDLYRHLIIEQHLMGGKERSLRRDSRG